MSEQVTKPPTEHASPDWTVIEVDYSAGMKSVRQIAAEHGITHPAILKRAGEKGWVRDLKAKIKARADAKVTKAAVTSAGNQQKRAATENAQVEAGATLQAQIRLAHRGRIERAQLIVENLFCELAPAQPPLLVPGDKPSTPLALAVRADIAKGLTGALRVLVALERQAFGIGPDDSGGDDEADFVERMIRARARAK